MGAETETSLVDEFKNYIKERIESPFVPTFLLSWIILNNGFVIYWIFGDANEKFEKLAGWDFSDFLFGGCIPYLDFYLESANSIIHPTLAAIALSLGYSSFSFLISGWRYRLSSWMRSFALKQKSNFDKVEEKVQSLTDLGIIEDKKVFTLSKIEHLESEISKLETKKLAVEQTLAQFTLKANNTKYMHLFNFLSLSIMAHSQYLKNKDDYKVVQRGEIAINSLVTFVVQGENYSKKYELLPVHEFFSIYDLFVPENESSVEFMYQLLIATTNGRIPINGKEFEVKEIFNFEPKTTDELSLPAQS